MKKNTPDTWTKKKDAVDEKVVAAPTTKSSSYVRSTLTSGEEILYEGKLSLLQFFWQFVALGVLVLYQIVMLIAMLAGAQGSGFLGLIFIGILAAWVYISYISSEFALTNKKIVVKHGFISRATFEYPLRKIESIQVKQSVLGRIFNFGDLVVQGAGRDNPEIKFIRDPLKMRNQIAEMLDASN